jgi:hypothetical protein
VRCAALRLARSPDFATYAAAPPSCGAARCRGCAGVRSLRVWWDTENCPVPKLPSRGASAGALGEALREAALVLAHARARPAGAACRVVAVHGHRYPAPLRTSLRTHGVESLDAGHKRGAVDVAIKCGINDAIVEELLLRGCAAAPAAAPAVSADAAGGADWIVVVSGDCDYADDVRRAKRAGFRVAVIFAAATASDYVGLADAALPWATLCAFAAAATPVIRGIATRAQIAAPAADTSGSAGSGAPENPASPPLSPPPGATAAAAPAASRKKPCRNWAETGTCAYNEKCRFAHASRGDDGGNSKPPTADNTAGGDGEFSQPTPPPAAAESDGDHSMPPAAAAAAAAALAAETTTT